MSVVLRSRCKRTTLTSTLKNFSSGSSTEAVVLWEKKNHFPLKTSVALKPPRPFLHRALSTDLNYRWLPARIPDGGGASSLPIWNRATRSDSSFSAVGSASGSLVRGCSVLRSRPFSPAVIAGVPLTNSPEITNSSLEIPDGRRSAPSFFQVRYKEQCHGCTMPS